MIYSNKIPSKDEFYPLYIATGWNESLSLSPQDLELALKSSYGVVSVYDGEELVGFGRIVSDGIVYATIHDVIVAPNYQQQGIGSKIIRQLVHCCEHHDVRIIHLFAARGAEHFYQQLGFVSRPVDSPGMVYEKVN